MIYSDQAHGIWKNLAMFLGGVVVTFIMTWATYVRNSVTREEMENYVNQRHAGVEKRLELMDSHVLELKEAIARLEERSKK